MSKVDEAIAAAVGAALVDPTKNSDLELKTIQYDPTGYPNSKRAYGQAAMEGLDVVLPENNQLQIDIDNEHSYMLFQKQMQIVHTYIPVVDIKETESKSGKPWKLHITVTLEDDVTTIERLALQAMLGSDRVRELLGYIQYKNNDPNPVLFLEKKQTKTLTSPEILNDSYIPY